MALVSIMNENRKLTNRESIAEYLGNCGVRYDYWMAERPVEANAPAEASCRPTRRKLTN